MSRELSSMTYNIDCMEYMRSLPDKYFDLCIAISNVISLDGGYVCIDCCRYFIAHYKNDTINYGKD